MFMKQQQNSFHTSSQVWNHSHINKSTEMDVLATSMMLTTIAEDGCGSQNQLNKRWGSATTRKSYRTDLASLASTTASTSSSATTPDHHGQQNSFADSSMSDCSSSDDDEWGFYMDE
uniref:Uncharacterized protein n=1 Tax=Entomoneis paludosa TaxID=265537 RepID=A0A7S2YEQ0_9STRA|mmetsp:Transcript_29947/g.62596  ORF Transcript_29947/g.62596 Transcript_29947/m.62596 type:complete len:117 (+) Transcript_29947:217-567(+)|eukprot:CAMPEP_0172441612 /NCGR_PEP_ID=MMETSP1065-20121228/2134_1 /TAXON_ID=265537 /ORGANISM="Amphiprora paludosa, Strain CCMP125" /LENGTH=116 /DNA_ID=CAMNT_0013191067 /DNA_START=164 /DNA_END=514 /DNA_ORIENTATION=+